MIEHQQNGLRFHPLKADIGRVGEPWFFRPVADRIGDVLENRVFQTVPQGANAGVFFVQFGQRQFGRATKANNARDVFRAATPSVLGWSSAGGAIEAYGSPSALSSPSTAP